MPKVSIVIATWNSASYLEKLFSSLLAMSYPKDKWEIIVVENGSTDDSKKILLDWQKKLPQLKTIICNLKNVGFAPGYNQGIKKALEYKSDYITLLNDDTIVESDWLDIIIGKMESDKSIGLVQPLITRYPDTAKINSFGNCYQYTGFGYSYGEGQNFSTWLQVKSGANLRDYEPDYLSFTAVVIRRQVIDEIGLLDPNYFAYHEDTDYSFRARLAGWRLLASPEAIIHHNYKFPSQKNKIRYFWLEKNRLYLMLKFFQAKTLILVFPAWLLMEFGLIFFSILRGFFWQRLHAYFWILINFAKIIKERQQIQATRQVGDRELFKYMTGKIDFQEINNPLLTYVGNPILNLYFKIIKKFI